LRATCAPPSAPVACVRSRDIYGHACHAQSRGGSSAIGNCQSRVPQYSRLSSRPDIDQSRLSGRLRRPTVDYQVACGALQSILRSPAAPYSRFSGRLRRARVDYQVKCASHGSIKTTIDSKSTYQKSISYSLIALLPAIRSCAPCDTVHTQGRHRPTASRELQQRAVCACRVAQRHLRLHAATCTTRSKNDMVLVQQ
jgi:hypothetical protein